MKNLGFSIIEIIGVVAIIAILGGISVPVITKYSQSLTLNNEGQKIVSQLRLAQQLAVSEQIKYSIQFNTISNYYSLIKESPTTTLETFQLPPQLTFINLTGFLNNKVTYNAIGAVDFEGQVTLHHTNGQNLIIQVKPSGYVTKIKL